MFTRLAIVKFFTDTQKMAQARQQPMLGKLITSCNETASCELHLCVVF